MKTNSRDAQNLYIDSTWWVLSKNMKILNFLLTKIFVTASWKSHFDFPEYLKISPNKSSGDSEVENWNSCFFAQKRRKLIDKSFQRLFDDEKSNFDVDTRILKPKVSWSSKAVGGSLYSLAMRDVLNIKIDAKLILIDFKSWFRCQIRVQRGRKPWCTFRGRNYIRDRDIDVGHVQKVVFSDLCHEISCSDFSLSVLIRFRWGFF